MKNWFKSLIVISFVFVIGITSYCFLLAPLFQPAEHVTSDVWVAAKPWNLEIPQSNTAFENGVFRATACQHSSDSYGASLIQQGDNPHSRWSSTWQNPASALKKNITIFRNDTRELTLSFSGKRTSQIEWFSDNETERFSNIGILLVGDIGRDYYNPDISQQRALWIDIYLDMNPEPEVPIQPWNGTSDLEHDFHSGFNVTTMPEVDKEYQFDIQIDNYIRLALIQHNLDSFTLKMVQCYVEAKASKASIEVNRILITTD